MIPYKSGEDHESGPDRLGGRYALCIKADAHIDDGDARTIRTIKKRKRANECKATERGISCGQNAEGRDKKSFDGLNVTSPVSSKTNFIYKQP